MPRFYCYYCDAHLTHDSASVRKQHNTGFRHKVSSSNAKKRTRNQCDSSYASFGLTGRRAFLWRYQANYRAYFFQFENALRDQNEAALPELNITPEAAALQAQVAAAFQEEVNAMQGTNYYFPPPRMPGHFPPPRSGPPPGWNPPPSQHPGYGPPRYPPRSGPSDGYRPQPYGRGPPH